ncbi:MULTISPECIES: hypothetical protein [unclassified Pseudomonas]|uniref:hypothetical protein n=1 Tax=unclassified Pseudomonas TaxID=196821 RepID=UPI000C86D60B|nr:MULTISPECIES: hypothetical protein [unclassified Pseudomonas]PMV20492.1 hypothetical protein C1X17_20140 [Pseudomonas sp. FW305-3-2-15-C-TSA2]PMV24668.1 hypothetical protein C1X22_20905 [Pseudomonas sp. DP16D-L5]PMV37513.1 hypothetical protein C1X21_18685 [Pseudomonas sp. FW305-3-2-15-A-LB2]PMV43488.1 hypothetical protein C1X16_20065 [Pseudomonas sp. FW305-3-2-15-C-R2A1]PMV45492.1 hypothetical protein C1X18_24650 [Pseudomonas sp. FW305-3-2-15-C-LB1]
MSRRLPLILLLIALPLWLAASYGARYGFMEDGQWVGICVDEASRWECQLRSNLGLMIHFKVLGWTALITSVLAFFVPGRVGWGVAVLGMTFGLPALALYNTTFAVFAVVIAGLRLVRKPRVA